MARSFGDAAAETVGVHAEPEIMTATLDKTSAILILASDGVWEFLTSQDALNIVAPFYFSGKSPQEACDELVKRSVACWNKEEDVVDDTTAVVMFLNYE